MLCRQYVVMGLTSAVATLMEDDAVMYIDSDGLSTACYLSEEEQEEEDAAAEDAEDGNEFFDEDAERVYDECGDVRVLVPNKQMHVPPVCEGDALVMCAASRNVTALLYESGYFRVVMTPPTLPEAFIDTQMLPADIVAEVWAVSDTHLAVGASGSTGALLYVYALPDITKPALRSLAPAGQTKLNALAFTPDGSVLLCANDDVVWRLQLATYAWEPSSTAWNVPDLHSLVTNADVLAVGNYAAAVPHVQLRRFTAPQTVIEEWDVLDDGGCVQASDVQLFLTARGLVVSCNTVLQVYALP